MSLISVDPTVAPVGSILVVHGAKTHAVQSVFLDPVLKLVCDLRVGWIDQAMRLESSGKPLDAIRDITVVPTVVDNLD